MFWFVVLLVWSFVVWTFRCRGGKMLSDTSENKNPPVSHILFAISCRIKVIWQIQTKQGMGAFNGGASRRHGQHQYARCDANEDDVTNCLHVFFFLWWSMRKGYVVFFGVFFGCLRCIVICIFGEVCASLVSWFVFVYVNEASRHQCWRTMSVMLINEDLGVGSMRVSLIKELDVDFYLKTACWFLRLLRRSLEKY